jgi:TonB-dependent starch-binding outer membrane protein SusC
MKKYTRKIVPVAGVCLLLLCWQPKGHAQEQALATTAPRALAVGSVPQQSKSLKAVLKDLETEYKVSIMAENDLLEGRTITKLKRQYRSLEDALADVLTTNSLKFDKVSDRLYVIRPSANAEKAEPATKKGVAVPADATAPLASLVALEGIAAPAERQTVSAATEVVAVSITGRVTSEGDGAALPGVTVVLKGTSIGTATDSDGRYSLSVPDESIANGTLIFSFIGYLSREVPISNRTSLNLSMTIDRKALEEVVVVGYGTVKKSDLTGSVASVTAEQLTAYPAINVVQALQGRAAGVQIQANNGEPGASFKVRIRGGTSINASSDPIYVVDGFVGGAMPPPEDIESIEVLKDASATAIYGSRGANGVILVTTKKGKAGKTRIDYNSSISSQTEINRLDLLNAAQFTDYIKEIRPNYVSPGADTDWQNEVLRRGSIQNHQLSIAGGSDAVRYYISGAMYDQAGILLNSGYKRYSVTSNIDIKASEKMRMGLNLFAQRTDRQQSFTQEGSGGLTSGVIASAFKFEPDSPIIDPVTGRFTVARLNDPHDNPYAVATQLQNESTSDRIQANFYVEYDLLRDLKFRSTFGATSASGRNGSFAPTTLNSGRNVGGSATVSGNKSTQLLNENYLTYSKTISDIHDFNIMAGYSYQTSESENWAGTGTGFITDAVSFWNLGGASVWQRPASGYSHWQIASFYGRVNYSLKDRYLFTANLRQDGSSNFSKNHKWATFPSGAFAWKMSNESFMQNIRPISTWKWRASYGLTGNQAISPFQTLASFSDVYTIINNRAVNAARPTTVANDDLTWETTAQVNIGADIGLFNDRINLSVDAYRMVTRDLLFSVPLPSYSGFTTQLQNIGSVENKGLEFALNTRNLVGEFKWNMDVNVSINRNKVLKLPGGNEILYGSGPGHLVGLGQTQVLREGLPVGVFFGWIYDGVYQVGDEFKPGGGFEQRAGGEKFRDIDGLRDSQGNLTGQPDGRLNSDDRAVIGNPHPKFTWGWNNDFSWKNFDLNVFVQGSQGNDLLSYTLMELNLLSGINNATTAALNRWTPTNTNTDVPAAMTGRTRRVSTRWVYDGSYARLKNLALGYNLPQPVLETLRLNRLRVFISAQNILTLTKYEGYDPEVNYNSGGSTNSNRNLGLDYGSYPNAKSYTAGINIGF